MFADVGKERWLGVLGRGGDDRSDDVGGGHWLVASGSGRESGRQRQGRSNEIAGGLVACFLMKMRCIKRG